MCVASSSYYRIEIHQTSKTFVFLSLHMDSMGFIYCVRHTFHHESMVTHYFNVVCGLTLKHVPSFCYPFFTLCKNLWLLICVRFFVWACPIFLQTMPKIDNLCILFWTCIPTTKLHFIKVVFTIIISTLTKADPFFLCRYYLSTLSEDKEKYILIRERGVVIQLFAMHIHIMCVMQ